MLLHQQVRQGERRPDRGARRAAGHVRQQDRAAPPGHRRGPRLHRLRRPRPPQGVHVRRRQGGRDRRSRPSMADEVARRRDQLLEAAAEADDDVLTKYLEGEEIADAELEACLRKGVKESILAPVLVGSAATGIGLAGAARRDRPLPPLPRRRGPGQGASTRRGADVEVAPDPDGPLLARVFKTAADPFVGRLTYLRVFSGTLHSQGHVWNAAAARRSASASSCCSTARTRSRSASSRPARSARSPSSSVTATGDTLSTQGEAAHAAAARRSPSRRCHGDRAPDQDRPRQDGPRAPADARGGAVGAGRAERDRRADPADPGRRPGGGDPRAAQAQVRRRDRDPHAAGPLPRDDPRQRPRPTAGTRSRPAATACSAHVWLEIEPNPGGGVEFAEKVVGGSVPRQLLPGRREGRPRDGGRGRRSPATRCRLQGDAVRRLVPHGRLERAVVQDRGVDGPQGRDPRRPSRSCSSRS